MANKITTLRKRRVKSLPNKPGTDIHFVNPDLAVVVQRQTGGGAGGGAGATIDVCKCTKTEFKCTTTASGTICKEQCVEWECTTLPGGMVIA
jgi:hypothetical protein